MSVSFPVKATFGVLAGGATVAGGTLIYKEVSKPDVKSKEETPKSKKSVAELIKNLKKDKRLISNSTVSDPAWQATGKLYRENNKSNSKDVWSVEGGTQASGSVDNVDAPAEFINTCKSKLSQEILDETDILYSQVVSFCTRDTLVSDLISETKGKSLLTKGDGFANNEDGKAVGDLYRGDGNSLSRDKGSLWQERDGTSKKESETVLEEFASECEKKAKVSEYRLDSDVYKDVLKYCTKAG